MTAGTSQTAPTPPLRPGQKVVGMPVAVGRESFRDRVPERERLGQLLAASDTRLITVTGRRGIGKSALVAEVLEGLEEDSWPHTDKPIPVAGIVYVSTRTSGITLERIFLDCARMLGGRTEQELLEDWTSPRSPHEKVASLLAALPGGLYIVLLDNLEDKLSDEGRLLDDELEIFFKSAFRTRVGPRLLVTSQIPLVLQPEELRYDVRLRLDEGLPEEDAVALLRQLDPNGEAGLRDAPAADLRRAARQVYGVPRALELIASAMLSDYLTFPTLSELLQRFAQRGDVVTNLAQDRYYRLDEAGRQVLQAMAVFGVPVGTEPVEWALRPFAPTLDPAPVLAQLARIHMVNVDRQRKAFALHPMDRDLIYAELQQRRPEYQQDLERQVAEWYRRQALPASEWRSVDDVLPQRREIQHWLRAGDVDEAARALVDIDDFLSWRGSVRAVRAMHAEVQGRIIDPILELRHLVGFGRALSLLGQYETAISVLEPGLELARRYHARLYEGRALAVLGTVYRQNRRLDDAVVALEEASGIFAELDDPTSQFLALLDLGLSYAYQRKPAEAFGVCDRIEQILARVDDPLGYGRLLDARSLAFLIAERWSEAVDACEQSIARYEEAGIPEAVGYVRNVQGMACLALGDVPRAIALFQQGVKDGHKVGAPRIEALCMYNAAWAYWVTGRQDEAVESARKSLETFRELRNPDVAAATALLKALRAAARGDDRAAAGSLLDAAQESLGNADLYSPAKLATEARRLADAAGAQDVAAAAAAFLAEL
jgi:tetratricopeptide (TPR) repeat protein